MAGGGSNVDGTSIGMYGMNAKFNAGTGLAFSKFEIFMLMLRFKRTSLPLHNDLYTG